MRISGRILFFSLFMAVFFNIYGQDDNKETARQIVEIANDAYFNLRVILIANEQYVQAAELDPENIEANYMAGRTFLETNAKANAVKYLLRVEELNPNYKFNNLYMIGQGYQYGLEFENAIKYYNSYLTKLKNTPSKRSGEDFTKEEEAKRRIYECQNGLEYVNNPKDYIIDNVGSYINSEWDDFAPVLNEDETLMVFTTRRQDGNTNEDVFDDLLFYEDIFYSTRSAGGEWKPAVNIGPPVNNLYHDSNLAINTDGTELYIYRSQNGGDIFLSEKTPEGTWSEPVPLNENINSTFSENSVSISPDGTTLFFSSDRPITEGKTDLDIYYSKKDRRGNWGPAKNIGPAINTEFNEDGPFIDYDGKTLYFSSKGHKGMGGYDIYKTVYDSTLKDWSEPINLGYPMNSPDNDVYFVSTRDGQTGYYASARADGFGFTDIYHIKLAKLEEPKFADSKDIESNIKPNEVTVNKTDVPEEPTVKEEPVIEEPLIEEPVVKEPVVKEPVVKEPVVKETPKMKPVVINIKAFDNQTNRPLDVTLKVNNFDNNQSVRVERIGEGLYKMEFLNNSPSKYKVVAQKSGFMYKYAYVNVPAATTRKRQFKTEIALDKIREGYHTILRNIYFDFGKATLKPESNDELDNLLQVLQQNPNYIIEISGHTDNIGTKEYNKSLSLRRAQAVVNYLVNKGQSKERFQVEGYGDERPLASNDDNKEGRELNRRVEFRVLSNN